MLGNTPISFAVYFAPLPEVSPARAKHLVILFYKSYRKPADILAPHLPKCVISRIAPIIKFFVILI